MSWQTKIIFDMLDSCPAQYGHPNVGASARSRTRWFHFHVTPNYRPRSLDAERPKFPKIIPAAPCCACYSSRSSAWCAWAPWCSLSFARDDCLGSDTDWSHEVSTWIQNRRGSWGRRTRKPSKPIRTESLLTNASLHYQHGSQHANEALLRSFWPSEALGRIQPSDGKCEIA